MWHGTYIWLNFNQSVLTSFCYRGLELNEHFTKSYLKTRIFQVKTNVHAHVNTYSYGLIPVWVISISDVNRTMFVDEITLKRRINSKIVLWDFVVFTCKYYHSKYRPNDQQTIIQTHYSRAICVNPCCI